jgi:NADPH2:quinone reductase
MDLLQREGRYPVPPQAPRTLGVEFSGIIESLGPRIIEKEMDLKIGDEVFGLAYGGLSPVSLRGEAGRQCFS